MVERLRQIQSESGALFAADSPVPVSFGNDAIALEAARSGVAICDRSHWGRLQICDSDRQNFLHNQTTNDIKSLKPGQGCDTVFVTSTARTLDLVTVYVLEDSLLVVVSPNRRQKLLQWCDRYIFFGDRVAVKDSTEQTAMFSLVGPDSAELLGKLGLELPSDGVYGTHQSVSLGEEPVRVAIGSGLALPGYTLITPAANAATLWQLLAGAGAIPLGEQVWEQLRIEQGRPMPDRELTEDYNPLEAGLWQAVSFNKGCYIGQETIARLDTYKGVKQRLLGLRLSAPALPGTPVLLGEEKIGVVTSLHPSASPPLGLAYIRTKAGGVGLQVEVDGHPAEVVEVPFLTHQQ